MPSSKPPRSSKRKRQDFLIARCSPAEKAIAEDNASKQGLSMGDYLRMVAIGAKPLHVVKRSSAKAQALLLLKAELNKIGSNINQVAKVANMEGKVSQQQIRELLDALGLCYQEIAKLNTI